MQLLLIIDPYIMCVKKINAKGSPEEKHMEEKEMKMREEYTCPLELTHDIIKGKWKPIILWQLSEGARSLSSLKKEIKGISQKMLIQHLSELHSSGAVGKTIYEGYPLKVDYFLTGRGKKIFEAVSIMQSVGIEMMLEDGKENFLKEKGLL